MGLSTTLNRQTNNLANCKTIYEPVISQLLPQYIMKKMYKMLKKNWWSLVLSGQSCFVHCSQSCCKQRTQSLVTYNKALHWRSAYILVNVRTCTDIKCIVIAYQVSVTASKIILRHISIPLICHSSSYPKQNYVIILFKTRHSRPYDQYFHWTQMLKSQLYRPNYST